MTWDEVEQAINRYVREREVEAIAGQTPPTGKDLVEAYGLHGKAATCPECGEDCGGVALADLVYTFEVCTCDKVSHSHLAEQLHHRSCFLAGAAK